MVAAQQQHDGGSPCLYIKGQQDQPVIAVPLQQPLAAQNQYLWRPSITGEVIHAK